LLPVSFAVTFKLKIPFSGNVVDVVLTMPWLFIWNLQKKKEINKKKEKLTFDGYFREYLSSF